jgi:hypothetical protein
MFFKLFESKLQGMCATYVDDALHEGNMVCAGIAEKTMNRLKYRDTEMDNVTFSGVEINMSTCGFQLHQQRYISALGTLRDSSTFQRSVFCRPD